MSQWKRIELPKASRLGRQQVLNGSTKGRLDGAKVPTVGSSGDVVSWRADA